MDIEIILEPDLHPNEIAEIAVKAEEYGIRALWSSNYHQNWDAFISLVPAAQKTSKILLGPLAVSPFEMHPLKMANSILTLNELADGRAIIAVGGGGGTLGAMKYSCVKDSCPGLSPFKIIRAVKEAVEVLNNASSKKFNMSFEGDIFKITRPYMQGFTWAKASPPKIYTCSTEPQMLRLGGRLADGLQMSDVAIPMLGEAMQNIKDGIAKRESEIDDFRIGVFPQQGDIHFEFLISSLEGLSTYFPSIKPTLEAPTGPIKGIPEIARAAEDAMIDKISASFSLS